MEHPYEPPRATLTEGRPAARGFLAGGQPLWKAFWLFFTVGFVLVGLVAREAMVAIVDPLMQESDGEHAVSLTLWGIIGIELAKLAYLLLSLVVVWRCGRNSPWAIARHAGVAVVLALMVLGLYSIYLVLALLATP
ncbi:hypothetical protein ACM75N_27300 [Pseudomonas paraeruginosa]|uniref:Membrane protein n=1 Tax=Pseudomonas paraeruginosa TaxID=2994495 RepID=A0A2R3ILZ0_9PSED|nr:MULTISPECIES: hypothetical protein [Pseudomonas aeruginosa group]AVK02929.1 putative membrane protein [Pseudomonas paraeruginosa]AWE91407.1 putative membrane protein [Pseudomonas paraeruginosa]KSD62124.1 hypothetical protein AO903_30520 [Pseudomonas aeruginosa]MCT9633585.1 hypothetical protein [Pseudomonas aeruginosa]MCW8034691.1 hypothetical protein [Pseudomonas aeruginosa]